MTESCDAQGLIQEEPAVSPELTIRKINDVSVVDVPGRIVLGGTSKALRDTIAGLLVSNQRSILLNLGEVTYVDSAGIGELVYSSTTVANQGGKLKLLNVTKRVKDLMRLTGITHMFEIYEDEGKAVASFS
jgi:anti-sigma B factor antagonist